MKHRHLDGGKQYFQYEHCMQAFNFELRKDYQNKYLCYSDQFESFIKMKLEIKHFEGHVVN